MKWTLVLIPLGLLGATAVKAHHLISEISIDGIAMGAGSCLRVPPNTNPMTDVMHNDMACNVGGHGKKALTCQANAGSKVTLQWRAWPDGSNNVPIDVSHQGPCSAYMKRMNDDGLGNVAGGGWFKIFEDGVANNKFCTERLRENGGRMTVTIPKDLEAGYYTLRGEHLALHQAQDLQGAQWYVGCAQLYVQSTGGNAKPKNTVAIPGYVTATHPGVLFNMYQTTPANYPQIPGPPVYKPTAAGGGSPTKNKFKQYGSYPQCLVKNSNWCGVSLPSYKTELECWASSQQCYDQADKCYKEAGPTGYKGCTKWEADFCKKRQDVCHKCTGPNKCPGSSNTGSSHDKRTWKGRLQTV